MPASTTSETPEAAAAVRAAVARLARPNGDGGVVIERAAIVAEGRQASAIEGWIVAHGGEPEVPLLEPPRPGLYGPRNPSGRRFDARPPRRYVLPAHALERHDG
ncbi:hypothetical protein C8N24_1971 [Solirubrobacter pauli]|uniref:Uncharacterized protein n=1 Tax=Solirubrobacter pauli TaxID=166793 RepID=A0A660LAU4_9ACTN|nr:hypothetical protein [Solirubrobacter pauli]RKQ92132.1 hypothetical protein C8N24_1971 [Solirubrobacter pauli]